MALEVTDANFFETLANNEITVVDFWAPWCGPCKMLGPIIEELATDNPTIGIGKLNVDNNTSTPAKFGIRGIPAIIFFKNGVEVDRVVGVTNKAAFQAKIDGLK